MKCLIVEDDSTACKLLQTYLADYGDCFIAVDGHLAFIPPSPTVAKHQKASGRTGRIKST